MIKEAYEAGWAYALEKLSAPRWVKELTKDGVSEIGIKRLAKMGLPERTIKELGAGSSQLADLVMNPKHGLSVRKVPLVKAPSKLEDGTDHYINDARNNINKWKKVKDITEGKGPFAHIKGHDGVISYYQYAAKNPKRMDYVHRASRIYSKLEKMQDDFIKIPKSERNKILKGRSAQEWRRKNNDRQIKIKKAVQKPVKLSDEAESYINLLNKKMHTKIWDHDVPRNIVDGKIVDMEFGRGRNNIQYIEIPSGKMSFEDSSRSSFLGKNKDAQISKFKEVEHSHARRDKETKDRRRREESSKRALVAGTVGALGLGGLGYGASKLMNKDKS